MSSTFTDICFFKNTFSLKKLKKLRPKVMEIFTNLRKKFCEYPPWFLVYSFEK